MIRDTLFFVSNISIALSYAFIAIFIIPRATVHMKRTKIGAVGFFALCGLHHVEIAMHLAFFPNSTVGNVYTSFHMLLIDVPQSVFVWMFVTGLYIEFVKWGPWGSAWPEARRYAEEE